MAITTLPPTNKVIHHFDLNNQNAASIAEAALLIHLFKQNKPKISHFHRGNIG